MFHTITILLLIHVCRKGKFSHLTTTLGLWWQKNKDGWPIYSGSALLWGLKVREAKSGDQMLLTYISGHSSLLSLLIGAYRICSLRHTAKFCPDSCLRCHKKIRIALLGKIKGLVRSLFCSKSARSNGILQRSNDCSYNILLHKLFSSKESACAHKGWPF